MTRRDRSIVGLLVVVLALIAGAIAVQGSGSGASAPVGASAPPEAASPAPVAGAGSPDASATPAPARPLREGVVGRPTAINPLLAANRADDALVALVFSGLTRLGEGQAIERDLASEWATSSDGKTWVFKLREDARWHDGAPVTARDVVFTVGILRDPAWTGPGAASWRDVSATAVDPQTVRFELQTPIGGFLQAATQRILPAHLLQGVDVGDLAAHPFNLDPVGSGPFRLEALDDERAVLVPADTAARTPLVSGIELRFFEDATSLADAWTGGRLDTASGLPVDVATGLATTADSRLLRYPTSTLTAVVFNLRVNHPEFRDPRVRVALLRGMDRRTIVDTAWKGRASVADAPIPSVSWAFDPEVSPAIPYDRTAGTKALDDAGWTPEDGKWTPPEDSKPFTFELLSPDVATNPATFLAAAEVTRSWKEMGLGVTHRPLATGDLVKRVRSGDFGAAVLDINVGLDPDLYPLLGSTQGTSQGLNLSGLVDTELDKLLEAARAPGSETDRKAAYRALQERLAARQYLLPIAFRDELVVLRDVVDGPAIRQVGGVGDRFWDVLTWRLADDR